MTPNNLKLIILTQQAYSLLGIGDDLFRSRLEMTAALNYGFVTYIDDDDNMIEKITRLYDLTSQPVLKEVGMEVGQAGLSLS